MFDHRHRIDLHEVAIPAAALFRVNSQETTVAQERETEDRVDSLKVLAVLECLVGEERIALETKGRLFHIVEEERCASTCELKLNAAQAFLTQYLLVGKSVRVRTAKLRRWRLVACDLDFFIGIGEDFEGC